MRGNKSSKQPGLSHRKQRNYTDENIRVRELVVVVRMHRKMPDHLARFVDNVLF